MKFRKLFHGHGANGRGIVDGEYVSMARLIESRIKRWVVVYNGVLIDVFVRQSPDARFFLRGAEG